MTYSSKLLLEEWLEKGKIVEVASEGAVCGLDDYEYCIFDKCQYWDNDKKQCKRFVWISIMYKEKYHEIIMLRDKAKENIKLSSFLKIAI